MGETTLQRCAAHGVVTRVQCVSCGAPVCLRCQVETETGLRCLDCAAKLGLQPGHTDAFEPTPGPSPAPGRPLPPVLRARIAVVALVAGALLLAGFAAALWTAFRSGGDAAPVPLGQWRPAPDLTAVRGPTVAVTLRDGRVLAVGGGIGSIPLAGAEVYDPGRGTWSRTADLHEARRGHAAVVLGDGRVLVAGGLAGDQVLSSAEIYQPSTGTWTDAGPMREGRFSAVMTALDDGRVLIAGGTGADGRALSSAELFDPRTSTWNSVIPGMTTARTGAAAVRLNDGRVLVTGGADVGGSGSTVLASAELFDPAGNVFTRTGAMRDARQDLTATRLLDGKVLVAGGATDTASLASAEIFDPARGTWTATGAMRDSRRLHGAVLLHDGMVLVSAGETLQQGARAPLASAELFDPRLGRWSPAAAMGCPRRAPAVAGLGDGSVLVLGGDASLPAQPPAAQSCVERFVPPDLPSGRGEATR